MKKIAVLCGFFLLSMTIISAQVTPCPANYSHALDQTQLVCDGTGRNQACYGNNTVNITPFSETIEYEFDEPGDMTDVEIIRTLSLSALDADSGDWGISMLRLLANLDPSRTDDVTMILFGDVEIESAIEPAETRPVISGTYANIRRFPNTSASIVNSITANTTLIATARLVDNSWIQVTDSDSNVSGWIYGELLNDFDSNILNVVEATQPYFAPMQAFYFRSGSQLDCASVPSNGLMIQTPVGVARVTVWVNEVTIDFMSNTGATAMIQMPTDDMLAIDLIEVDAYIQSDQGGYIAVEGSSVTVDLSNNGNVSPKVNPPIPSNRQSDVPSLTVLLDRLIESSPPANVADIAGVNNLSTGQYDELVEYGYVITHHEDSQSTSGASSRSNVSQDQTTASSDTTSTEDTQSENAPSADNGGKQDCPGNSCNAPGHNKDKDKECPGNSCNAPGQNKDKDKKDKKNK